MAVVRSSPSDYWHLSPPAITVHALKTNARPIGFAPWPERDDAKAAHPTPAPERDSAKIEFPKKRKKRAKK